MSKISRLHIETYGDPSKPAIVLLHGLMGSWRTWHLTVEQLSDDFHFVMIDMLGFGDSPKPFRSEYTLDDHIEAIVASLQDNGYTKPSMVVGFSLGSVIANYLVRDKRIQTKKLLLIGPPIYPAATDMTENIKNSPVPTILLQGPVAAAVHGIRRRSSRLSLYITKQAYQIMPEVIAQDIQKVPYRAYIKTRRNVLETHSMVTSLPQGIKTHIVIGENDRYVNIEHLKHLASSKEVSMKILSGMGHAVPFKAPELLAAEIRKFAS